MSSTAPNLKVTALVPAHDEGSRIGATVRAILTIPQVTSVIVIDDASDDDTADLAEAAGAKVVRLYSNVGKGGALQMGATRSEDADIILLLDGDLGDSAAQASLLLEPVLSGGADMAIARFPRPAHKAGFGMVMNLAHKAITDANPEFDAQAPLSGQRAMIRECLDATLPFGAGYGAEVVLTVRALRAGFRLVEVETTMTHAATGRDVAGFIHRGKQFVHVALAVLKLRREGRGR